MKGQNGKAAQNRLQPHERHRVAADKWRLPETGLPNLEFRARGSRFDTEKLQIALGHLKVVNVQVIERQRHSFK